MTNICSECGRTCASTETKFIKMGMRQGASTKALTITNVICADCQMRFPNSFQQKEA